MQGFTVMLMTIWDFLMIHFWQSNPCACWKIFHNVNTAFITFHSSLISDLIILKLVSQKNYWVRDLFNLHHVGQMLYPCNKILLIKDSTFPGGKLTFNKWKILSVWRSSIGEARGRNAVIVPKKSRIGRQFLSNLYVGSCYKSLKRALLYSVKSHHTMSLFCGMP